MGSLKITKKHHKHINNPFPSKPKTLPFIHGTLIHNPQTVTSQQIYDIGLDFQLNWSSANGGSFSIHHRSHHSRSIWATVPGRAFVSAAVADTEVVESRGSFLIKDRNVHFICCHQTIEDIRIVKESSEDDHQGSSFFKGPAVMIKGRIFNAKEKEKKNLSCYGKYWVVFDQKNSNQVGFRVRFGKPKVEQAQKLSERSYSYGGFARKSGGIRRPRVGWRGYIKNRVLLSVSPEQDENVAIRNAVCPDFNRVRMTYSCEKTERFYGFGEQFSHMDLKGKRVPIIVQEQGIGRGDQPITFAANLVSYRAAGDESTTYAPSPYYMTSKMRSLYLEGYSYSVFDLTEDDCVQVQVHGDMIEGRILSGQSPVELIEHFTEAIGRPQPLPEWILWGAVVGMQGGTDKVRRILGELKAMDTPISAFWRVSVPQEPLVFFMRAGFRNSPKWASLFWEGDQMVSWQANDGIKSAVVGLLSSGLSGYAFNHSDIGGYCAVTLPFLVKYQRSEELLLRWMELSAFTVDCSSTNSGIRRSKTGSLSRNGRDFHYGHLSIYRVSGMMRMLV